MAKQTSFSHQKMVLEHFSSHLAEFSKALLDLSDKYEQTFLSLYEEQGLMDEIYSDYKSLYLDSMKEALLALSERVSIEDTAFVEKEIEFISSR